MDRLQQIFRALPALAATEKVEQLWQEIEQQYSRKSQAYHNQRHLEAMINGLEEWPGQPFVDRELLLFSIFYHDLVYQIPGKKNESRSAARAAAVLTDLGCPLIGHNPVAEAGNRRTGSILAAPQQPKRLVYDCAK